MSYLSSLRRRAGSSFFHLYRDYFFIFDSMASAVLFADLENMAAAVMERRIRDEKLDVEDEENQWIKCDDQTMKKRINMGRRPLSRALKELESVGVIEVKLKGIPSTRYIRISDQVDNLLDARLQTPRSDDRSNLNVQNAQCANRSSRDVQTAQTYIISNEREINVATAANGRLQHSVQHSSESEESNPINLVSKEPVDPAKEEKKRLELQDEIFYIKAATKLEEIAREQRRTNCKSKKKEWAKHVKRLHRIDKIPKNDIRDMLKWYKDHAGEQFIPECYSGRAFRDKWFKLVSARERTRLDGSDSTEQGEEESPEICEYWNRHGWCRPELCNQEELKKIKEEIDNGTFVSSVEPVDWLNSDD